jgi:serine palmitoyltransferase
LCQQGADGTGRGAAKLAQLKHNSNFVRNELRAMGCEVLGDEDSPVRPPSCIASLLLRCMSLALSHAHGIVSCALLLRVRAQVMPIMLYNPGKIPAFSREARAPVPSVCLCEGPTPPLLLRGSR